MTHCHSAVQASPPGAHKIALVGAPNVGKSLLFHRLTGHYVLVSNYPGTTVEVAQGQAKAFPEWAVVDTPGIIAFPPRTEDEEVTARALLEQPFEAVLQVGDAKNLRRTLNLTIQLAEMGVPLSLALNMMDEAQARGVQVDIEKLSDRLDLPVIPTVATLSRGVSDLEQSMLKAHRSALHIEYPQEVEEALGGLVPLLPEACISQRSMALQWLAGDRLVTGWLQDRLTPEAYEALLARRHELQLTFSVPLGQVLQQARSRMVEQLAGEVLQERPAGRQIAGLLSRLSTHPLWGLPILAGVLYAMYWFVGVFGAGTLVGLLEERLFGELINPWLVENVRQILPVEWVADLLVGQYGLWTMGVTYAAALLLPIVITFFLMFGALEDSGYLPRLAVLSNRMFRLLGLNGKAVLPMVLGLGCVTMATLTTRILSSKRDRLLVIFLLALAVPCSAQLGVVLGMLAGISFSAAAIWSGLMLAVLLLVGWLAARLLPGEREPLVVELPPLRVPAVSNVFWKTLARLEWYVKEAVPLFMLGTLLMFTLDRLHVLPWLIQAGEPLVTGWLGLPAEASSAFLLGFLRRDFAATGLFAMQSQGILNNLQVLVAIVTITLFIPCIASTFMIWKERGPRMTLAMAAFIFPFAFLVGGLLYRLLSLLGWGA